MGRRASAVVVALAVLALAAASARAEQLIVVVTDGWDAPRGELRRFARDGGPGTPWQAVGGAIPVVVGHAGLGWGAGLRPRPHAARGDGGGDGDRKSVV